MSLARSKFRQMPRVARYSGANSAAGALAVGSAKFSESLSIDIPCARQCEPCHDEGDDRIRPTLSCSEHAERRQQHRNITDDVVSGA
jgi:hypothetical protein